MQQGPQDLPAQLERVALGGLAHSANLQWQEVSEEALRGAPEHPETIASLPGYLPLLVIDSVPPGKKTQEGRFLLPSQLCSSKAKVGSAGVRSI